MGLIRKVNADREDEILRIIAGGAPAKADIEDSTSLQKKEEVKQEVFVGDKYHSLRMPASMMKRVDEVRAKREGITRTTWILEAIQEKLRRDCK